MAIEFTVTGISGILDYLQALRRAVFLLRIISISGTTRARSDAFNHMRNAGSKLVDYLRRELPIEQGSLRSGIHQRNGSDIVTVTSSARHRPYVAKDVWQSALTYATGLLQLARFETRLRVAFEASLVIPGYPNLSTRSSTPVHVNLRLSDYVTASLDYSNFIELRLTDSSAFRVPAETEFARRLNA